MSRLMSDAEIRRRKKVQGHISEATGALGLTALTGTLLATKTGGKATKGAFDAVGMKRPGILKPKKLKKMTAPVLATSAGIGGAGSFNFAAYTNAESRKKKQPMIKRDVEWNVAKFGEWKSIDQRERTQTRQRKTMRAAGGVAGVGAGLATVGYHEGDKATYQRAGQGAKVVNNWRKMRNNSPLGNPNQANKRAFKALGQVGSSAFKGLGTKGKVGVAAMAGAATVGGAAKIGHTYQQSKINERRRNNHGKSNFGKADMYHSPFEDGYYGEEGRREDFENEVVSKALGGVAAAPAGPRKPAGPAGPGGMRALRPAGQLKPMLKKPASPNVKAMRAVPLAQNQNTAGLSTPGR